MKHDGILLAALDAARDKGLTEITRKDIAEYAEVSEALVSYYLGSMGDARRFIILAAIAEEDTLVCAEVLALQSRHPEWQDIKIPAAIVSQIIAEYKHRVLF